MAANSLVISAGFPVKKSSGTPTANSLYISAGFPAAVADVSITGTTCWGHSTGVTEDNIYTFSGRWTGTGTISGAGDAEVIQLDDGETMESDIVNTGSVTVTLETDKYATGDAGIDLNYRTAATYAGISGASWTAYSVPFASSGFVQAQVENPV